MSKETLPSTTLSSTSSSSSSISSSSSSSSISSDLLPNQTMPSWDEALLSLGAFQTYIMSKAMLPSTTLSSTSFSSGSDSSSSSSSSSNSSSGSLPSQTIPSLEELLHALDVLEAGNKANDDEWREMSYRAFDNLYEPPNIPLKLRLKDDSLPPVGENSPTEDQS